MSLAYDPYARAPALGPVDCKDWSGLEPFRPPRTTVPKIRHEVEAKGVNEYLQLVGSDPFKSLTSVGLRVPYLATSDQKKRYLFLLASFQVPYATRFRVRGIRQFLTIGFDAGSGQQNTHYQDQILVTSPFFAFSDGNVSWHLRKFDYAEVGSPQFGPLNARSFAKTMAHGPALLYKDATFPADHLNPQGKPDFYTSMTAYTPPFSGKPPGEPLVADWSTFYDQRVKSRSDDAWNSLDVPVDGPCVIGFFASIKQTNPETRSKSTTANPPANPTGQSDEEAYLRNYPLARYNLVGGGFIVEED